MKNMTSITSLLALCIVCAIASAADLYKWTDSSGRVHYGDAVPLQYRNKAKEVDTKSANVTEQDRQDALARNQRIQQQLSKPKAEIDPVKSVPAPVVDSPKKKNDAELTCEEQWQKYDESWACYNPYRIKGGIVKGADAAAAHCTPMEAPKCVLPSR